MKAFLLRCIPTVALLGFLASGTASAGTLTANGAVVKPHDTVQPADCANPPCLYSPTTTPPINNDPNSEAGHRNIAKTSVPAHPARKSKVPEGSTFYFLLIGAVVFFFMRFVASRKKEG